MDGSLIGGERESSDGESDRGREGERNNIFFLESPPIFFKQVLRADLSRYVDYIRSSILHVYISTPHQKQERKKTKNKKQMSQKTSEGVAEWQPLLFW